MTPSPSSEGNGANAGPDLSYLGSGPQGHDQGASPSGDRAFVPSASSPQAVSPAPASIPSAWRFDFWGDDIVKERRRVRALFEAEGISVGRRQHGAPSGLMLGSFDIQKWRNLRKDDVAALDGELFEDGFPIRAVFATPISHDLNEALHRVNARDLAAAAGGSCTMGAGCDGVGVCYAKAQGRPDMCPRDLRDSDRSGEADETGTGSAEGESAGPNGASPTPDHPEQSHA